jgi:nicotinate-nucleotide adenylyltransferase
MEDIRNMTSNKRSRRIGILGGTFDPIHAGHLAVARHALSAMSLDEVILMPNGVPAWKLDRCVSPASDRWAMAWLATRNDPHISVSRMEVDRPGITITVDTARNLRRELPEDTEAYLIAGADSVAEMPGWNGIGEIARSLRIVAVTRPGTNLDEVRRAVAACPEPLDVTFLEMDPIPISSTVVRNKVRNGEDVSTLVGDDVACYIRDAGLYVSDGIPCGERELGRPTVVPGRDCVGVATKGIIIRNGATLMLKRIQSPESGNWDLPGGVVALGETLEEAIMRGICEETGLDARITRIISMSDHIVPSDETHLVDVTFLAEAEGEPRNMIPSAYSNLAWIPLDALPRDVTQVATEALSCLSDDKP